MLIFQASVKYTQYLKDSLDSLQKAHSACHQNTSPQLKTPPARSARFKHISPLCFDKSDSQERVQVRLSDVHQDPNSHVLQLSEIEKGQQPRNVHPILDFEYLAFQSLGIRDQQGWRDGGGDGKEFKSYDKVQFCSREAAVSDSGAERDRRRSLAVKDLCN